MVQRKIFIGAQEKQAREWWEMHHEGLQNLYTSPCMIRMTKIRRVLYTIERENERVQRSDRRTG